MVNKEPRGEVLLGECLYENTSLDNVIREVIERKFVFEKQRIEDVMMGGENWISKRESTKERALTYVGGEKRGDLLVISEFLEGGKYGLFRFHYCS